MAMERETTGLYFSGHPMDEYREAVRKIGAKGIGSIISDFAREDGPREFSDDQTVTIAGVVSSVRTRTTKNNSLMAYIVLEDDTGAIELLAFQRALDKGGGYVTDNAALIIKGRISLRDEKEPQIIVDGIRPLNDLSVVPAEKIDKKRKKIYVRLRSDKDEVFKRIERILVMFPGSDQMVIYFEDTKKRMGANCIIHEALVTELCEILGDENVVVK